MIENQHEKVVVLLMRADGALESAELLLKNKYFADSVSRSYYAMFYAASAALTLRGIECKTHRGLLAEFSRVMVKSGEMRPECAKSLDNAFAMRQDADYDYLAKINRGFAEKQLADAEKFVADVKKVIESQETKEGGF